MMSSFLLFSARAAGLAAMAASCLLMQACGGKATGDASQVVATVNKNEISVHQVNQVLRQQPAPPAAQTEAAGRQALERLIEQELAVQKALDMKLDRDPAVMQAVAAARREVLARAYAAKVADGATKPTAGDVQAYYDARPALFAQRKVYALQEFAVQAEKPQVDALGAFVTQAKSLADVTGYLRNQQLGVRANQSTQPAENLPPALLERLNAMKDGQLLLLAAPGGARIVVLAGSRVSPVALEQARPAIEQALLTERRRQVVASSLEAARKNSDVKYLGAFAQSASVSASATAPATAAARPAPAAASAGSTVTTTAEDAAMVNKGLAGLK